MRNSNIYNTKGVAIGPAPNTGYHFMDYTGGLNDDTANYPLNNDLLMDLSRVQSVSYNFNVQRENITQLGKKGTVKRAVINSPTVSLDIVHLLGGLKNEARMGLNVNYPQYDYPNSGAAYYEDNFNVNLLQRLDGRELDQPLIEPFWPHPNYQDRRNIFVGVSEEGEDLKGIEDPAKLGVIGFGNCYLRAYNLQASVGQIPTVLTNWTCENIEYYDNGSGQVIPTVDAKTREHLDNIHFNMPSFEVYDETDLSVISPGNITVEISGVDNSDILNFGIDAINTNIQSFDLGFSLEREPLDLLEYKLPVDRQINYPIIADVTLNYLVGETETGSFFDALNEDKRYDVSIKMFDGCTPRQIVSRFDLKNGLLESSDRSSQVRGFENGKLTFTAEINPEDLSQGLFISGDLNIHKIGNNLLTPGGLYLTDDSGNRFVVDYPPLF
tara:strand:+ start:100237 stop:101556 length:1320 start_codon:yes stop_codon:yes gene_type:complete